ncbi:hypothetical protein SAMN05421751_10597 [Jhaorihella thermophila]|uniref:Lipoprotein n=1 Tax=Jhaorihella thermophila TaxID=488547 RepID=A0A1H5V1W7_9RHOB|nr:hypothetical protein SAMN05421751_10597 [Jhaorihella thermophila]
MPRVIARISIAALSVAALAALAACDPGPNGYGTAPPGVSQAEHDARVKAKREARRAYYAGPRGGAAGL